MKRPPRLSRQKLAILRVLREAAAREQMVTIREIGDEVGLNSSGTIHSHLVDLENLKLAERDRAGHWWATDGYVTTTQMAVGLIMDVLEKPMSLHIEQQACLKKAVLLLEGRA